MSELYYESITDKNFQYHEIEEYKDLCYLRHPSGVIVVSLNKDHVGMGEEIVKVEWDVNKKGADKVKSNIVGRGKKGGRTLYPNTTLCILMTKSGKEYPIKFGMKASCIEMNDRLEANPDLILLYIKKRPFFYLYFILLIKLIVCIYCGRDFLLIYDMGSKEIELVSFTSNHKLFTELSSKGMDMELNYGWIIFDMEFYVWRTKDGPNGRDLSHICRYARPQSLHKFTEKHVAFFNNPAYKTPTTIIASRDGNIKLWRHLEEEGKLFRIMLGCDLIKEVFFKVIDGINSFILVTDGGNFYQMYLSSTRTSEIILNSVKMERINKIANGSLRFGDVLKGCNFSLQQTENSIVQNLGSINIYDTSIEGLLISESSSLWEFDVLSIFQGMSEDTHIIASYFSDSGIYLLVRIDTEHNTTGLPELVVIYLKRSSDVPINDPIEDFEWITDISIPSHVMTLLMSDDTLNNVELAYYEDDGLYIFTKNVLINFSLESSNAGMKIKYNSYLLVQGNCLGYTYFKKGIICIMKHNGLCVVKCVNCKPKHNISKELLVEILEPWKTNDAMYKLLCRGFIFHTLNPCAGLCESMEVFMESSTSEGRAEVILKMYIKLMNSNPLPRKLNKVLHGIPRQLDDKSSLNKIFMNFLVAFNLDMDLCFTNYKTPPIIRCVKKINEMFYALYNFNKDTTLEKGSAYFNIMRNAVSLYAIGNDELSEKEAFYTYVTYADKIFDAASSYIKTITKKNSPKEEKVDEVFETINVVKFFIDKILECRKDFNMVTCKNIEKNWTGCDGFLLVIGDIVKSLKEFTKICKKSSVLWNQFKEYMLFFVEFMISEELTNNIMNPVKFSLDYLKGLVKCKMRKEGKALAKKYNQRHLVEYFKKPKIRLDCDAYIKGFVEEEVNKASGYEEILDRRKRPSKIDSRKPFIRKRIRLESDSDMEDSLLCFSPIINSKGDSEDDKEVISNGENDDMKENSQPNNPNSLVDNIRFPSGSNNLLELLKVVVPNNFDAKNTIDP